MPFESSAVKLIVHVYVLPDSEDVVVLFLITLLLSSATAILSTLFEVLTVT